jgi:uncharacterized protein (TIGR01370 family)
MLIILILLSIFSCSKGSDRLHQESNINDKESAKVTISGTLLLNQDNENSGNNKSSKSAFNQNARLIYVLQNIKFKQLKEADFDIAVIDPDDSRLTRENIEFLHTQNKILLAYLSIGEAENYRNYWGKNWKVGNPVFLDEENPDWEGNYRVKFWNKDWQEIIFNSINKIAELGYDGAYLDIIDAYSYYNDKGFNFAKDEMINFVLNISKKAKDKNRDFLIVPQNSEELVENEFYLASIDGIGRENLWFVDDKQQDENELNMALKYLENAADSGKFVFVISYLTKEENKKKFTELSHKYGFIHYIGKRELDCIGES